MKFLLPVQTHQHYPLPAQSVGEAPEDDPAEHDATEVDGCEEGSEVGSVTDQAPLENEIVSFGRQTFFFCWRMWI